MSLNVLDVELTQKNIIKEQTTWNTSHLHEIAWSSEKLDYDRLFAVFHDIKVMNAEVFAKGFEKCRLLTRLLGQNVENLDDFGCPKSSRYCQNGQFVDLL